MGIIVEKSYSLKHCLEDEVDALNEVSYDYDSSYICDAIMEVADSYIPIYTGEVWANVENIAEYVEDAISEGVADINSGLISIFQSGYYVFYQSLLYDNLEEISYNHVANKINEFFDSISEEDTEEVNVYGIQEEIESQIEYIDNNNTFEDLNGIAEDIIERIKEGEFNL